MVTRGAAPDAVTLTAGILTGAMAIYHFALPISFHWDEVLHQVPMLRWGVWMINACMSFLLLAGGVMTVAIAFEPPPRGRTSTWVLRGMGGFWLFNATCQVVVPMPLPPRLAGLRLLFLGFAAGLLVLYAVPLLRSRLRGGPRTEPSAPTPSGTLPGRRGPP